MNSTNLKETIRLQREKLTALLAEEMHGLALTCAPIISDRDALSSACSPRPCQSYPTVNTFIFWMLTAYR